MIETEVMSNRFIGDGNNKTFAFGFKFNNKNDIQVWLYDSTTNTLTQREDFTLTPNNDTMPSDGGTVTFPSEGAAIPSTQMAIVQRHMNLFQLDVYKHGMFLDLDNFEHSLDTLVLEIQQVADGVDRAIKYPINQTGFDPTLPTLKDGQTIMVNDDGNGWTVIDVKELFDQTNSAWAAASNASESATTSQKWAESLLSPDDNEDEDSPTEKTMSSKSWALESKEQAVTSTEQADLSEAWAQSESSPDGQDDEESTTSKTKSSRSWALDAKNWAQSTLSPDGADDSDSATGETQSSKEWALYAKSWAMDDSSPDNETDNDSETTKTQSSKSWALYAKDRALAAATSETNASTSEDNAKESETNAKNSEDNAKESEENAKDSEINAADSAELADAWAQSTSSPDGQRDTSSPTGKTMSARDWVLYVKELIGESGTTPFSGATASSDGEQGLVPAPLAGQQNHVLKGDGTWGVLEVADDSSDGLAPKLVGVEPSENDSNIVYLDGGESEAAWKRLPYLTGASDGVVKKYAGSEDKGKMYLNANGGFSEIEMPDVFTGATSTSSGTTGVVPAPEAGQQNYVLVGSGEWKLLMDFVHPVGQILAFNNSVDPNDVFSGTTWERYGQGRVLVGAGSDGGTNFTLGSKGGEEKHQLSVGEMPSHGHGATITSTGGHTHASPFREKGDESIHQCAETSLQKSSATYTSSAGGHTHSATISNTGSSQSHNNMQPYVVVNYWVRTA